MDITQIDRNKDARVIEIQGGRRVAGRLEGMGIVPGRIIRKKSAAPMKGPIVLEIGTMQAAIGYGMAKKVMVEPL